MPRFLLTSLVGVMVFLAQIWSSWPDKYVHLVFCDVGQGDATLITAGFTQILIDGGRGGEVMSCLEEHLPFWDRRIELLVATHADADHIGGLDDVLAEYEVSQIMTTEFAKDTDTFLDFKKEVEEELRLGAVLKKPILGQQISFSQEASRSKWIKKGQLPEITFSVISPQVETLELALQNQQNPEDTLSDSSQVLGVSLDDSFDYNDLSIAALLEVGEVKVLLMGDLEQNGELALINSNLLDRVDILKVGHHGAKTSSSLEFISQVRPETSLVSVGGNNSYGHPSPEVIDRLMQFDSNVLRTDELGTIEIVSNGDKYWLVKELPF